MIENLKMTNLSKRLVTIATYNSQSTMKSDFSCDMMKWDGKHSTEFLPVGKAHKAIFRQAAGQQMWTSDNSRFPTEGTFVSRPYSPGSKKGSEKVKEIHLHYKPESNSMHASLTTAITLLYTSCSTANLDSFKLTQLPSLSFLTCAW